MYNNTKCHQDESVHTEPITNDPQIQTIPSKYSYPIFSQSYHPTQSRSI